MPELLQEWNYSKGSKFIAATILGALFGSLALGISSLEIAEAAHEPSGPSTSEPAKTAATSTASTSCDIVIIESIFHQSRVAEVIELGERAGLDVEIYEQSSSVRVAFVRFDSEPERDRIIKRAATHGWNDAYTDILEPDNC